MLTDNIKKIYFNGSIPKRVYYSDLLVWERTGNDYPENSIYLTTNNGLDKDMFISTFNTHYSVPSGEWYEMPSGIVTDLMVAFYESSDDESRMTSFIGNFDTSNVTSMYDMFYFNKYLTSVDITSFDTSNVTDMRCMFNNCSSLTSLNISNFNTSNVTNMASMFYYCLNLTSLDLSSFNTYNVESFESMFNGCSALTTLNLGNSWDMGKDVTNKTTMFSNCTSLTTVTGTITNIKGGLDLSYSPLTNESAMVFINGLANVGSTRTIKFSSTTFSTLTEEQIAIATNKGWSVASA